MPQLDFKGRSLNYLPFGKTSWDATTPVYVVLSTEYRDTETAAKFYREFPDTVPGIILDPTNMGGSSRLDRSLEPEEVLEELRHVLAALNIARPVIVGYCSNAELAMYCGQRIDNAAIILHSPLVRWGCGAFIEMFYGAMKRAILARDAYNLTTILNLVDLHSKGFRENKNFFLADQIATAQSLKDPEHFWIKTLQNKPTGQFDWEDMPACDRPVLMLRGVHDPLQPINFLRECMQADRHQIVELDNSHRILDDQLEQVIDHMTRFVSMLSEGEMSRHLEEVA